MGRRQRIFKYRKSTTEEWLPLLESPRIQVSCHGSIRRTWTGIYGGTASARMVTQIDSGGREWCKVGAYTIDVRLAASNTFQTALEARCSVITRDKLRRYAQQEITRGATKAQVIARTGCSSTTYDRAMAYLQDC